MVQAVVPIIPGRPLQSKMQVVNLERIGVEEGGGERQGGWKNLQGKATGVLCEASLWITYPGLWQEV